MLDVPFISLDALYWQPNWKETPVVEFRAKVAHAIETNRDGWVVDGEYGTRLGNVVQEAATDVICTTIFFVDLISSPVIKSLSRPPPGLDPPLLLYFPRIVIRTVRGLLHLREPCSPGCYENVRGVFFSKQSILWWCLSHHWVCRKQGWAAMRENGVRLEAGGGGGGADEGIWTGKMRRIGGWGAELRCWLEDVQVMVRRRGVQSDT